MIAVIEKKRDATVPQIKRVRWHRDDDPPGIRERISNNQGRWKVIEKIPDPTDKEFYILYLSRVKR